MSNPFAGINNAPPSMGGQYLLTGQHKLQIEECKVVKSQRKNADMFVVATTVIESTNPEMSAGSQRSWICNFQHASALSNIRQFVSAALGVNFNEVDEDVCAGVVTDENPLAGTTLNAEAFEVPTRAGGVFTKVAWSAAS